MSLNIALLNIYSFFRTLQTVGFIIPFSVQFLKLIVIRIFDYFDFLEVCFIKRV